MTTPTPPLPADARERVFAAANALYEQAGRETLPTVDQVRRHARVDMHAASAAMREWRRQQTAQASPVAVAVPELVVQASTQAIAALWTQAQALANASLREAQAGWDAERAELEQLRAELAEAFERQADELALAQGRLAACEQAARDAAAIAADELKSVRLALTAAGTRAERAEASAAELEHRVMDLRGELDRAHADAEHTRAELKQVTGESEALRAELARVRTTADAAERTHQEHRQHAAREAQRCADKLIAAQSERNQFAQVAGEARERAARLAGQLEAVQAQNAALLTTLGGRA